ncbi:hypothetical protein [Massilia glaciei]|uniref:Uncharacterized protein n=1 Tax=Massilia glaciei TaxID=1524097 RepID=A0A2U2HIZ0_9BURK|nr:hypothetical protein [Massilia glaciei]PWF46808.1 hypothetical protein C7C56_015100 [Massilia glaciei]
MKTMKWLLRREFWEHKGALVWAPIVVGIAMVVLLGGMFTYAAVNHADTVITRHADGTSMTKSTTTIATELQKMQQADKTNLVETMSSMVMLAAVPLLLMLAVIAFFYCLGALYEERRDRSVLFWKSLPLSDHMTVLSKVATIIVVAPLITLGVATAASLALLLIACLVFAFQGINAFGTALSNADVYLTPVRLVGLLPVYALWALPTIGWLMMVSAWARSKVFLWAVGAPLLTALLIKWASWTAGIAVNMDWFMTNIIGRGLFGLVPGAWFGFERITPERFVPSSGHGAEMGTIFFESWRTLAGPNVWIGVAAGVAMLFVATRLRRWRDEG